MTSNLNPSIELGKKKVNYNSSPYVIAEIGVNHEGSMEKAKKLISLAKEGGANAAKFQSYKAETLASKNSPSYWDLRKEKTTSQFKLFKKYDSFNAEDYINLAEYCEKEGIDFLSTPFDDKSIDFLEPLVPFFKIASADITNTPFLRKIAQKNKPIILSTGASSIIEIETAINTIKSVSPLKIALLHCILNYPTDDDKANLLMINSLRRLFPSHIVGYSDHTLPDENMSPLISAFIMGAVILEKHFTDDKSQPGNDHYHSMDISDLKCFRKISNKVQILKGLEETKQPIDSENISRLNARRSIVVKTNLKENHILTEKDLTYKRPGTGISPLHWDLVIGKTTIQALPEDHILEWSDIN